jgi:hypothetical protein
VIRLSNIVLLQYRVLIRLGAKPNWNAAVTFLIFLLGLSAEFYFLRETVIFALLLFSYGAYGSAVG